jgi:hypothetical protein
MYLFIFLISWGEESYFLRSSKWDNIVNQDITEMTSFTILHNLNDKQANQKHNSLRIMQSLK